MIVAIIAAALAAADPVTPAPPRDDPAADLRAAQMMYDQSCQVRAYGSYDDLCDALRRQLRDAAKVARDAADKAAKDARKRKSDPAATAKPPEALAQSAPNDAAAR